MNIIDINKQPTEFIRKNWIGNVYKYRWFVWVEDKNPPEYTTYKMTEKGSIPIKEAFRGTKPQLKKWLKENNLKWEWEE